MAVAEGLEPYSATWTRDQKTVLAAKTLHIGSLDMTEITKKLWPTGGHEANPRSRCRCTQSVSLNQPLNATLAKYLAARPFRKIESDSSSGFRQRFQDLSGSGAACPAVYTTHWVCAGAGVP
jgi:hypothetical protein